MPGYIKTGQTSESWRLTMKLDRLEHPVRAGSEEERLLTAREVASILSVPLSSVYSLPIPRVQVGPRRIRWRMSDVNAFVSSRLE